MSRIEDQANYYKNYHLRYRDTIAVIHVEDEDDSRFWNVQLQYSNPGKYHFISRSRSNRGSDSTGCEQCKKYIPYLNKRFFICIDSDLHLLRGEEELTAESFIAQTYTYSWENHSCEAAFLQQRLNRICCTIDFCFISFLKELSKIVYLPLLYLVYYQEPGLNMLWNVTKFNKCLPLQPTRKELANNAQPYLQKVKELFDAEISSLRIPANFQIKGLNKENAYLHIQGHRLYDLITNIGTMLCKGKRVAFKSQILDATFPTSGYREIDLLQSDLTTILS
ncbi:MAG: DUF4435 domain-containing protein [Muribaculaceae bacterium]|nr:DUF4435 domain-containing protein [Muribaculaceae bacterium]